MTTPELTSDAPLSRLRGARVELDGRRAANFAIIGVIAVFLLLSGILYAAGVTKNSEITQLRLHGASVEITVTKCVGLLGGSGSNAAGYACSGAFTVGGHHFVESLPATKAYAPGTKVRFISSTNDPALIATPATVAADRASVRVFILPTIFLIAAALTSLAFLKRRAKNAGGLHA